MNILVSQLELNEELVNMATDIYHFDNANNPTSTVMLSLPFDTHGVFIRHEVEPEGHCNVLVQAFSRNPELENRGARFDFPTKEEANAHLANILHELSNFYA